MYKPKEIKEYLDQYIEGQEEAKKAAAVMMYNHLRGIKENAVFIGPSGCGKTEIFRVLKTLYPKMVYIYDASNITNDGWSGGKKYNSVFQDLRKAGYSFYELEHMLIVFDEFDKLCTPAHTASHEDAHDSVQSEMLTMIEGTVIPVSKTDNKGINTKNISFAFCGAFTSIFEQKKKSEKGIGKIGFGAAEKQEDKPVDMEDLVKFGMKAEMAGRINTLVTLSALNRDQVRSLLMHPVRSPFAKVSKMYQCDIHAKQEFFDYLLDISQDDKRGIRAITSLIRAEVNKEIYEAGSSEWLHITDWAQTKPVGHNNVLEEDER